MIALPGCENPIGSTTDMTLWWAAVLSADRADPSMSMMWLDRAGRMVGRMLCVTGVPLAPTRVVRRTLMDVHDAVVGKEPAAEGHVAFALCRPGAAEITQADDEWAEALDLDLEDQTDGAWSFHVAAGGWITPVTEAQEWRWRRRGRRLDLLDAALGLRRLR
jgi:hypothetical protein